MKFATVVYYKVFNNTFIVKEVTLIHMMSLACNYLKTFFTKILSTCEHFGLKLMLLNFKVFKKIVDITYQRTY